MGLINKIEGNVTMRTLFECVQSERGKKRKREEREGESEIEQARQRQRDKW